MRARVEACRRGSWSLNFWKHGSGVHVCQPPASQCHMRECGTSLYRWWLSYGRAPSSQPGPQLCEGRRLARVPTSSPSAPRLRLPSDHEEVVVSLSGAGSGPKVGKPCPGTLRPDHGDLWTRPSHAGFGGCHPAVSTPTSTLVPHGDTCRAHLTFISVGSKNPKIALKLAEFQTDSQGKVRGPCAPAGLPGERGR